ncbi:hypothetical protein [Neobacillus niacini]|uniref:hypothetical protein n=1 Tax=Neobacillus niacini TaxID=86668 RepID=UPI00285E463B|nr:hypothetical protein [Neobacillus niacini]MDR6998214.1 anionic cell wall polymer biosynthesis LytR-Cps2A-Psr (LCP) family protein [Neobacillus niacini]
MRKLVIVVIALSFLGYGPLKSLFHFAKESANELQLSEQKESANFLITENNSNSHASKTGAGVIVQYDQENHKIKAGSVLLPVIKTANSTPNFNELKQTVQNNYGVSIDHIFMLNPSSISKIIDQLAPEGVKIKGVNNPLHGKDVLAFIQQEAVNPENTEELKTILSSLKKAIKNQSSDKLLSIAPSIINEAVNSMNTDLGKGQLVGLGLSAIMNPITKIEPLQFAKGNEKEDSATVNSILEEEEQSKAIIN